MRSPFAVFSLRRILVGALCGGGVGVLLHYAAFGGPQGPVEEANWTERVAAFACIVAALGGIAGGVLRAAGWAMFVGGLIGAILVGAGGVVATQHLKGLSYSFVGAPFGALLVYLFKACREGAKPAEKACAQQASRVVWGSDLDR